MWRDRVFKSYIVHVRDEFDHLETRTQNQGLHQHSKYKYTCLIAQSKALIQGIPEQFQNQKSVVYFFKNNRLYHAINRLLAQNTHQG